MISTEALAQWESVSVTKKLLIEWRISEGKAGKRDPKAKPLMIYPLEKELTTLGVMITQLLITKTYRVPIGILEREALCRTTERFHDPPLAWRLSTVSIETDQDYWRLLNQAIEESDMNLILKPLQTSPSSVRSLNKGATTEDPWGEK